jgi:hypothetical protein
MAVGDVDVQVTKARAFSCNVFDGVDDYVEIPHDDSQLGANLSNGFTISAWINPRSIGEGGAIAANGRILEKDTANTSTEGFYFCIGDSTNKYLSSRINGGANKTSANNSITFGIWQHVLITISSAQLANFYVNGVLSGTANQDLVQTISTITTTNVMRIGNPSTTTDRTFDGSIRSVKMWNRVLTTDEIAQDYAGSPISSGLIHHFKLGGDYADYGSVGATATNSGSLPQTVEDTIATAIKTQRATAGATGKYLIAGLTLGGQVISTAITE